MFQPFTLTIMYISSVEYCYVTYLMEPPHPLLLPSNVPPPQSFPSVLVPHGIILPPGRHPYISQYTKKTLACLSLTHHFQIPTPPLLPRPRHACRIPVAAAPTLSPKYLITWLSAVFLQPPVSTTYLETSPLPHILSPFHVPRR